MLIEENGKSFEIENGRVVAAYDGPPSVEETPVEDNFDFGDRVSYREESGSVISIVPSLYGDTIGVKFDDGGLGEFISSQLTRLEDEAPAYASEIDGFVAEYSSYEALPGDTRKEVEKKMTLARSLNKRAKSMLSHSDISLADRVRLDEIVTATFVDHEDLKESSQLLLNAEEASYLDSRPKFKTADKFGGWGQRVNIRGGEDISWLDGVEAASDETDWDSRLADLAKNSVGALSRNQLTDDDFMKQVRTYTQEGLPSERHARYATYLHNAAELKLAEPEVIEKEASVETFDDVDDSALYL